LFKKTVLFVPEIHW